MKYSQYLSHCELWAKLGIAQKHSTYDSLFFILKENQGFKTVKFYNDSTDYRVSGTIETLADAYNEAVHTL